MLSHPFSKQSVERAECTEVLNHNDDGDTRQYCGREGRVVANEIEEEPVGQEQDDSEHNQNPGTRRESTVRFHGFNSRAHPAQVFPLRERQQRHTLDR